MRLSLNHLVCIMLPRMCLAKVNTHAFMLFVIISYFCYWYIISYFLGNNMHFTLKVDSIIHDFYVCHSFIGPSES